MAQPETELFSKDSVYHTQIIASTDRPSSPNTLYGENINLHF